MDKLYDPLPEYAKNDADQSNKLPTDFLPTLVQDLLGDGEGRIFQQRVQNKQVMLDNTPTTKEKKDERKRKKLERKRAGKGMSAKAKRELGLRDPLPASLSYDAFLPLHQLWNSYISELVGPRFDVNASTKLMRADYHGAIVTVTRSKSPTVIGLSGIVVKETENTFQIVSESNKVKVIPKADSVFCCKIPMPPGKIELFGNQLESRPAERSSRKPKQARKGTIDL